jgi:hypothetical protein
MKLNALFCFVLESLKRVNYHSRSESLTPEQPVDSAYSDCHFCHRYHFRIFVHVINARDY